MKLSRFILNSIAGNARPGVTALALSAMLALSAHAQTPTVTPHSHFNDATITSTNSTIDAIRVPAFDQNGNTYYWDVDLVFDTADDGTLTLAAGYPIITKADNPLTAHFKPGTYVGPNGTINNSPQTIAVSGPGVTSGGATEWTLALASGASGYTYPASATWYVGSLTSSPLAARIKNAGITSTAYSYGVSGAYSSGGGAWQTNSLLGFSQVGNTITIVSFTNQGTDYALSQGQITFTLK